MRMKKRWKTILLSLCMALALIPAAAFAADTDKAIQLGTGSISGYDSTNGYDYIYYGTWNSSPIEWRVLSMNGNSGTYSDGTETVDANNAMFLLSDGLLGTGTYGGCIFSRTIILPAVHIIKAVRLLTATIRIARLRTHGRTATRRCGVKPFTVGT